MTPNELPIPFWTAVEQLQKRADNHQRCHQYFWVADEQLEELLERPNHSDLSPEEFAKLGRQPRNRSKKYFNRKHILIEYVRTRSTKHSCQSAVTEARDSVEAIKQSTSKADYELLCRLAGGGDYESLSDELGVPLGTLKARVSRARMLARKSNPELA